MKRNFLITCISALTLTTVSCSEVKQTDIQPELSDSNSGISETV